MATYEALDDRTVRVRGSVFRAVPYTVKLEGAAIISHRTIFIGGIRDPILIGQIDGFLDSIRRHVAATHLVMRDGTAQLNFHVYGKNGVMGTLEPIKDARAHEFGLLCEVTAPTQELADAICNTARVACLHAPYPGQMATGGNMAFPLTPMENPIGPICAFTLYHLMAIDSPTALFPIHRLET